MGKSFAETRDINGVDNIFRNSEITFHTTHTFAREARMLSICFRCDWNWSYIFYNLRVTLMCFSHYDNQQRISIFCQTPHTSQPAVMSFVFGCCVHWMTFWDLSTRFLHTDTPIVFGKVLSSNKPMFNYFTNTQLAQKHHRWWPMKCGPNTLPSSDSMSRSLSPSPPLLDCHFSRLHV